MNPSLLPALIAEGSTRPFILAVCARLAYAALALLQPDFAIAAILALAALRRWLPTLASAAQMMPRRLIVQRSLYA